MFKMFVTVFLILSISMLTQSAPAADPEPASSDSAHCQSISEETCEIVLKLSGIITPFARRCCLFRNLTTLDDGNIDEFFNNNPQLASLD